MEKLKKVKKFSEKWYICPECGKKQTTILAWQTCSIPYEYTLGEKGSWEMGDPEGGDFEAYCCPECKKDILIPSKMEKSII